jgi:hypothetical protein
MADGVEAELPAQRMFDFRDVLGRGTDWTPG